MRAAGVPVSRTSESAGSLRKNQYGASATLRAQPKRRPSTFEGDRRGRLGIPFKPYARPRRQRTLVCHASIATKASAHPQSAGGVKGWKDFSSLALEDEIQGVRINFLQNLQASRAPCDDAASVDSLLEPLSSLPSVAQEQYDFLLLEGVAYVVELALKEVSSMAFYFRAGRSLLQTGEMADTDRRYTLKTLAALEDLLGGGRKVSFTEKDEAIYEWREAIGYEIAATLAAPLRTLCDGKLPSSCALGPTPATMRAMQDASEVFEQQLMSTLPARRVTVPYAVEDREANVFINDAAKEAIERADARKMVAMIDPEDPLLHDLLELAQDSWGTGEALGNAGHHSAWPELFEAGKKLLEKYFPEECSPDFGGEVLNGVGFVHGEDEDKAIDFMQRRPQSSFVFSKFSPAKRLHRDPDAGDYKSPGWLERSMSESDKYSYRFYNIWVAIKCGIDPSGQVWENPLLICLPRDGGRQEWSMERRLPSWVVNPPEEENETVSNVKGALSKFTSGLLFKQPKRGRGGVSDPEVDEKGYPELPYDKDHEWVTSPYMIFDSFDLWHGAGSWDKEAKMQLWNVEGRPAPSIMQRVSLELRFRARCQPAWKGDSGQWSPLSCAYRSGSFSATQLRPSGARWDLSNGTGASTSNESN